MKNMQFLAIILALAVVACAPTNQTTPAEVPAETDQISPGQATDGEVAPGSVVSVEYEGTFDNGTVFDASEGEPLQFEIGAGQIIPGFEQEIVGMQEGETKQFTVEPEDAYGEVNETLIQPVPLENFQETPEPGQRIQLQAQNGRQLVATVVDVTEDEVVLDLNHPLAGERLHFDVMLVQVS